MKLIRKNTFETNSSSTHSITMCEEDKYNQWLKGELFFLDDDRSNINFYTKEEREMEIKKAIIRARAKYKGNGVSEYKGVEQSNFEYDKFYTKENLDEINIDGKSIYDLRDTERIDDLYEIPLSYKEWDEYYEYEKYESEYITPEGRKIIAFGYYGDNY